MRTGQNDRGETTYSPDDGDQVGFLDLLYTWVARHAVAVPNRDLVEFAGNHCVTGRYRRVRLRSEREWVDHLRRWASLKHDREEQERRRTEQETAP